jgi:hypothetical protein
MEGAFNLRNMNNMPAVCNETKKDRGAFTCGLKGNTSNCCSFSEGEVVDCTNKGQDNCDTGGEQPRFRRRRVWCAAKPDQVTWRTA